MPARPRTEFTPSASGMCRCCSTLYRPSLLASTSPLPRARGHCWLRPALVLTTGEWARRPCKHTLNRRTKKLFCKNCNGQSWKRSTREHRQQVAPCTASWLCSRNLLHTKAVALRAWPTMWLGHCTIHTMLKINTTFTRVACGQAQTRSRQIRVRLSRVLLRPYLNSWILSVESCLQAAAWARGTSRRSHTNQTERQALKLLKSHLLKHRGKGI